METTSRRTIIQFGCLGLALVLIVSLGVAFLGESQLLGHTPYDSFTRQALAWRAGRLSLPEDVPHLELAIFEGEYYVSFPPVPSLPLFVLTFFFGGETPDGLLTYLYFLLCFIASYALALRYMKPGMAAGLATFAVLGGSLLDLAVSSGGSSGAVWYQGQLLGILLTYLAFLGLTSKRASGWAWGLVSIALAVGCRPFQAVYVVPLIWMLYTNLCERHGAPRAAFMRMPLYLIVPALIAVAYGTFNWARFGKPLEFGHNYLPEFSTQGGVQFSLAHVWPNLQNILRGPSFSEKMGLTFPIVNGFAFWLTNPMLFAPLALLHPRRQIHTTVWLLLGCIILHLFLLLLHRTFGGWQYGTRYLCDLLPALFLLQLFGRAKLGRAECAAMGALAAFNVYGTLLFHVLS